MGKAKDFGTLRYNWTYSQDPSDYENYESVESIRVKGTAEELCKLEKNKLKEGQFYSFKVSVFETDAFAVLDLNTTEMKLGTCYCVPMEGIAGVTLFNVTCEIVDNANKQYIYELYDKTDEDIPIFSGRMVRTSRKYVDSFTSKASNTLKFYFRNFKLTKGKIVLYCYNEYKMISETVINVKLYKFNGTDVDIYVMVDNYLHSTRYMKNTVADRLNSASIIPDLLKSSDRIPFVFSSITTPLFHLNIKTMDNIKLYLSSVAYIVKVASGKDSSFINEAGVGNVSAEALLSFAETFQNKTKGIENEQTLTHTIMFQMMKTLLDTVEVMLVTKNPEMLSKPWFLVKPSIIETVQDTSTLLVETLRKMSGTMLWHQIPGDIENEVKSSSLNVTEWVKKDSLRSLNSLTKETSAISFGIPPGFLKRNIEILGVQLTILKINPFWWAGGDIKTNVLHIEICKKVIDSCQDIHLTRQPVYLYYNISKETSSVNRIRGSTTQLDPASGMDLDLEMTVYRFDPPSKAKLFIQFEFKNSSDQFRVLFLSNLRPDYDMMINKSLIGRVKLVTAESPFYELDYQGEDLDQIYYMGILPGKKYEKNATVKFTLKIYFVLCNIWLSWRWGTRSCKAGSNTTKAVLQCECNHLSLFSGTVGVPETSLNPATIYPLHLSKLLNWLPLSVLVCAFVIYLVMIFWGLEKDKKDSKRGIILLLEDNYPGERYAYLIGVFTGFRLCSSTNANVGIKLFGEKRESRAHILKSSSRSTLKGNSDDWFLIYCQHHLGKISSIEVWHDNTGKSPDWFVEHIEVIDLSYHFQYLFQLHVWLALEVDEFPDAVVAVSSLEEYFSVKKVFYNNFVIGLRDNHYWSSILWKHPRNPVSRTVRITVVMGFSMVAMAISVWLFILFNREKEDDFSFSLSEVDLLIFAITVLSSVFAAFLVMILFRASYSLKYIRNRSSLVLRSKGSLLTEDRISNFSLSSYLGPSRNKESKLQSSASVISKLDPKKSIVMKLSEANLEERYLNLNKRKLYKTRYERFASALHSIMRGSSLEPVRLPKYKSAVKLNKRLYVTAWLVFVLISFSSSIAVIFFGWELPFVRGEKWITVFLLTILFDVFVLSTLKIFLVSIILSCVFHRLVSKTNYILRSSDGIQKDLIGDEDHLYKLARIRSHPKYCPLSSKLVEEYRRRKLRSMDWRVLIDFLVLISLTLVLVMLTAISKSERYYSNSHTTSLVTRHHNFRAENFNYIFNRMDFERFMRYDFIYNLYQTLWYNDINALSDTLLPGKEWAGTMTRVVGSVRIRQIRVILTSCKWEAYFRDRPEEYCIPPWSSSVEDTDTYEPGWVHSRKIEDLSRSSQISAWRYTSPEKSGASVTFGNTLTFYNPGGYIDDLGSSREDTLTSLSRLMTDPWLGHATRAVFVELTFYNVNTRLFCQVALVLEQMPTGEYLKGVQVDSVSTNFNLDLWNISFFIFLAFFSVRVCLLMNRHGIFVYLSNPLNVYEVFMIALGISSVILYVVHVNSALQYVEKFQRSGLKEFFSFTNMIAYIYSTQIMFSVLFACVVLRVLLSWRFGRIYFTFYYTTLLSLSWIIWLTFYFILYLFVIWRFIGHTLNVFVFVNYTMAIIYHKDFTPGNGERNFRLIVYMMCSLSYLVVLLFVTSFTYYYKVGKSYKIMGTDKLNFYTLLFDKVLNYSKRKMKK